MAYMAQIVQLMIVPLGRKYRSFYDPIYRFRDTADFNFYV